MLQGRGYSEEDVELRRARQRHRFLTGGLGAERMRRSLMVRRSRCWLVPALPPGPGAGRGASPSRLTTVRWSARPTDLGNFQRVTNGLIGSFQAERVPVTIFINEQQLNVHGQRDARAAVVEQWLKAGFEVGNHTYSHRSANNVPVDEFLDDIIKGEVIMEPLLKQHGKALTWLRYPYLHSGTTAEVHDVIVNFLDRRGYRVAPVTVDYADYSFAGVYRRELRARQHRRRRADQAGVSGPGGRRVRPRRARVGRGVRP